MKKLMIAAAIVCVAALSHGAAANSFTWTSSSKLYFAKDTSGNNIDLTTLKDGDVITAPTSGTKGYADGYSAITWTAEMILSTAGVDDETLTPDVIITSGHKINNTDVKSDIFSLPTEADVGKTYSWELVITGTWKDANGKEWSVVSNPIEGSKEFSNVSAAEISTSIPTSWTVHGPGTDPVPEPTSGLLLLLGVAGLSLRRKQK